MCTSTGGTGIIQQQSMPRWQEDLLQNVTIQTTEEHIREAMRSPLKIASDGSVQAHRASFAWVISTSTGERLVTCMGPAYGCKPTSYRAEGYGILSVLRFLHLIMTQGVAVGRCHVVCDNEALIEQMQQSYDPTKVQPNQTNVAEWDIICEIGATTNKGLPVIRYQHIKGHSDIKQPYERL
jgi:ribosomal protein L17